MKQERPIFNLTHLESGLNILAGFQMKPSLKGQAEYCRPSILALKKELSKLTKNPWKKWQKNYSQLGFFA